MEGDAIPSQTTVRDRVRGRGNRWVGEILLGGSWLAGKQYVGWVGRTK